jgi:O-antigen ligase
MITKNVARKLFLFSLTLMFLLPIFPTGIKPIVIALFFFSGIIGCYQNQFKFDMYGFIINSSVYIVMVISLLYSNNLSYGLKALETMSSLLVFPFIFSMLPTNHISEMASKKRNLMLIYVISITALNIIFFLYHFGHYKSTIITHYITVTRTAQGVYNIHPIYMSMHIGVAIIFSFFLFKKASKKKEKYILILMNIILITFLLIILKKGPIIGLVIAFTFFVILQKNSKLWAVYLFIIGVSTSAVITSPILNKKFSELLSIQTLDTGDKTSSNIRYTIFKKHALNLIKDSPVIGYGIGDYKDELLKSYNKTSPFLFSNKYNTHNQYLSFLVSVGFIGFSLFVVFVLHNIFKAFKFKNQELLLILVFYCFVMTTENILEREDGVIFFSFFTCFFRLIKDKKI